MNIVVYFLGMFSALSAFILSFPFYSDSLVLLGSCLIVVMIQYIIHYMIKNKKTFYVVSISIAVICLVLSLSGLFYVKDIILNKYMQESIYTFEIMGKYNYYDQFLNIFLTMLGLILPINTLNIFVFSKKKYILSLIVLFPFIFVEVLFTITPPLYCIPYILYCMIAVLSHHQSKIQIMPIVLSIALLCGVFYIVSPTTYTHPRQETNHQTETLLSTPHTNNENYDLMKQGNRYYNDRVELRILGITNQSFKLRGTAYDSFEGDAWCQTTSSQVVLNVYLANIQRLSEMFSCQTTPITIIDNFHNHLVYTPYFYSSASDTLKYYRSHYEGQKEENYELIIPNQKWNDYLSSSDQQKYNILFDNWELGSHSLEGQMNDNISDETYAVLDEFMYEHDLYDFQDLQDLIQKTKKAIFEQTQYSLTPGTTPNNENFFDYFLNKNKKGYCVHYASTLALVLRMNGFYANFVTGYQVDGSQSYDDYTVVYDSSSHAWVEVFDPILGFVPIEATPSQTQTAQNQTTQTQTPTNQTEQNQQNQTTTNKTENIKQENIVIPVYVYLIVGMILLMIMIYLQYRIRLKRAWKHLDHNQKVCQMYYRLCRLNIDIEDEMIRLSKKAKFSQHQLTDDEYQSAMMSYQTTLKELYKQSSFLYRFQLTIIYAYI